MSSGNLVYTLQLDNVRTEPLTCNFCKFFKCHPSNDQIVELINFIESFSGSRAGGGTLESSDLINELDNIEAYVQPSAGGKNIVDSLFKSSIVRTLHFYCLFS